MPDIAESMESMLTPREARVFLANRRYCGALRPKDYANARSIELVRVAELLRAAAEVRMPARAQAEDLYLEMERRGLVEFHEVWHGPGGSRSNQYIPTGRYQRILDILEDLDAEDAEAGEAEATKSGRKDC